MTYQEYIGKKYKLDERATKKIMELISKYSRNLNIYMLCEEADKLNPKTDEEVIDAFNCVLSTNWNSLTKIRLLGWDISRELAKQGFSGAKVDAYLIGLILNQAYMNLLPQEQIKNLLNQVMNYLIKKGEMTYSKVITCLERSKTLKGVNISFPMLRELASRDYNDYEKIVERIEKDELIAMENLQHNKAKRRSQ